ncbi:esterase, SGNH hydrolase-type [Planoprotostelium fungivorum]|uniref:Esterase, SGNH hydrolase-type n=1 Tax=Planoprotostelium fungivorum TaxID=1890364 RepID=A0A2P6MSH3_9EUKA|nr:esterase, SGNH hydrolase-type [Planoprotostelium fungivorum]
MMKALLILLLSIVSIIRADVQSINALKISPMGSVNGGLIIDGTDYRINFLGRSEVQGTTRRFDWPGIQIRLRISNTSFLDVLLQSAGFYEIIVDNQPINSIQMNSQDFTRIASNLDPNTWHNIEIYKKNEAELTSVRPYISLYILIPQVATLKSVRIADQGKFGRFISSKRRIEFVGDSITCGYGVIPPSVPCSGNGPNGAWESAFDNYVRMTATDLAADVTRVSWSGRGMVQNCCGLPPPVMPTLYNQTLGTDAKSKWNFKSWVPQAVVINLGTNDHNGNPAPSLDTFAAGYTQFIKDLRARYANVTVFTLCGGMVEGAFCDAVSKVSSANGAHYVNIPALTSNQMGCDGHPNTYGNRVMADLLVDLISKKMRWPILSRVGSHGPIEFIDRPMNDLPNGLISASSPADCQNRCFARSDCQVWAFDTCGTRCWLKSAASTGVPSICRASAPSLLAQEL